MVKKKDRDREHGEASHSFPVDSQNQEHGLIMNVVKKPKKHKHKKSSKKEEVEKIINVEDLEDVDISVVDDIDDSPSQSLKLKIKIPESSPEKPGTPKSSKTKPEKSKSSGSKKSGKKKEGKGDDDTDSEEERWLDAIESGKLEEVDDELKRMKNPRLMTARQRAMLEKRDGPDDTFPIIPAEPLLSLPSGFKEKVVTEEMLAKKAIKTQKRREQAQEKREEDKKKTVDRLLKKQDSKVQKINNRMKFNKKEIPMYTYVNNQNMISISVPQSLEFFMNPQSERECPKVKLCGVQGCTNLKKYSCSKTGIPLCSLECYKTNLAVHKSQISTP
ncbi:INO80 complex subunit B [Macrobrachium rosenbergii]|uniref:INO80 complex subunit B n=1 Tax=Macrobrachium rosenbergii TaxID=79674 RepID=UPI0034D78F8B